MKEKSVNSYAGLYLYRCNQESKSDGQIDIQLYKRLVELDRKLGTTASEQLLRCLLNTTSLDIIKVRSYDLYISFKMV